MATKLQVISKKLVQAGVDIMEANKLAGKILLGSTTLEKELSKLQKGEEMKKETKTKKTAKTEKVEKSKVEKPIVKSKRKRVIRKVEEVKEAIKEIAEELKEEKPKEEKIKFPSSFADTENYLLEIGIDKIKASTLTTKIIEGKVSRGLVVFDFLSGKTEKSAWERSPEGEKPILPENLKTPSSGKKGKVQKAKLKTKTEKVEKKTKTEKAKPIKKVEKKKTPGVIETIAEIIQKKGPISKEGILKELVKKFPDRPSTSMAGTIGVQVPSKLNRDKGFNIQRNEKGYFMA
jgi:hypothetical protein